MEGNGAARNQRGHITLQLKKNFMAKLMEAM